jgi:hypothetical protein
MPTRYYSPRHAYRFEIGQQFSTLDPFEVMLDSHHFPHPSDMGAVTLHLSDLMGLKYDLCVDLVPEFDAFIVTIQTFSNVYLVSEARYFEVS